MTDLHNLPIAEASAGIRSGSLTSVELIRACLGRIAATEERLNAFITLCADHAMEAAAAADREIAAGRWKGPLHGIPIGLKDIYATAGVPTTCHSRLLAENVPTRSADTVARLEAAGAIMVGKLATHEFAFGGPSLDLPWPAARNPWDPERIPGGSSSGSGTAVAAGMVAGAMGSDTGGSIRGPAGLCGIVGLKPSYGRLSRRGVYPLSWTQDHAGPMTRTVEDCALMMQVLSGYDPADPASVDAPVPDFAAALARPVAGLRVGVVRSWYEHADGADDEVVALIDEALAVMRDLGMIVRDVVMPEAADYHACGRITILSEGFAVHRRHLLDTPDAYGQFFRDRMRLGAFIGADRYIEAQRMRARLNGATLAAMADCDVLVTANQYGPAETFQQSQRTFPFFGKPYLTMPFNVTGQPALTVRCGFTAGGLPIGLQIAGRSFADDTVLQVGHAYERARGGLDRHPSL